MASTQDLVFRFKSSTLDEELFNVVRIDGTEGLSRLYEFNLELVSRDPDIETGTVLKNRAVIELERDGDTVKLHGIVASFEQRDRGPEWIEYRAVLVPLLYGLGLNTQCQIYLDKTVPEIVASLLAEDGLVEGEDFSFLLTRTDFGRREYTVQYQESDLNFIRRLLEHEGLYFFFRQGRQKEMLVITDNREAHQPISGDAVVTYRDARGVNVAGEAVASLTLRQEMKPANVILKDYNWRSPSVEMYAGAAAAQSGRGTLMEYGDHFKDPTEGQVLARLRAEELACQEVVYSGKSAVRAFNAGARFTLTDHFRSGSNIEYLLTEVRHIVEQVGVVGSAAGGEADQPSYLNEFRAIPHAVQFRPPRVTPKPRIYGTLNAFVDSSTGGEYADIDDLGRYKVRLPFDLSTNAAGKASRFIRMAQPYAGDEYGMHFPLHKGTEVLLTHVDGDPDRPIISASVPNATTPSPVTAGNQSQSVIQTAGENQIMIEDTTGSRFVQLSTPEAANGSSFVRLGAPGDIFDAMIPPDNPAVTAPNPLIQVILEPKVIAVPVYGNLQMNPTVIRANDFSVTWTLDPGDGSGGSITADGLYTAPPDVGEGPLIVTARATSNENPDKYDECRLAIYTPFVEPVRLYVAPQTIRMEVGETMQLTGIAVGVTQDDSAIGWKVMEGDASGTISLTGVYTPPATVQGQVVATVRAYLLSDPSQYAQAQITVFPAGSRNPAVVSVGVSPRSVRLGPNATTTFRATVTGSANTAVTWECDGPGTIDAGGVYTAPASFDSPGLDNIRARSVAQTNRIGEAQTVLYRPPTPPLAIFVDPERPTISLDYTQQFTALVVGSTNQNVRWELEGAGSIDTNGVFTPAATGRIAVRAVSESDGTSVGLAEVTVLAAGALAKVEVSPSIVSVVKGKTQLFTATVTGTPTTGVTWALAGDGAIVTNPDGTCTYTAPATVPASPAATLTATATANSQKTATGSITILETAPVAAFQWQKIIDEVTRLKNASELSEGDISQAANNSVSLTRKEGIAETQGDAYSSTIGNSWGYIKGNADSEIVGNSNGLIRGTSDSRIMGLATNKAESGVKNFTNVFTYNQTLGPVANVAAGACANITVGAFANITGGVTIDFYVGAKVTCNMGRNFKFYDVDDFEVIDKTSSTSARDKVSLECGPKNPGVFSAMSTRDAFANTLFKKLGTRFAKLATLIPPEATSVIEMEPDTVTIKTEALALPAAKILISVNDVAAATSIELTRQALKLSSPATMELAATGSLAIKSPSTDIGGALSITGVPVPPPPPPPPPVPAPPPGAQAVAAVIP